jgi:hypothetical protein
MRIKVPARSRRVSMSRVEKIVLSNITLILVLLILALATGVKIHFAATFPEITDWNYEQLKKIDKTKREFSFAVFGDNRNSERTFEELIDRVNKEDLSFVIDDGDMVLDGEKEKYQFLFAQLDKLHKPFLGVIGNHELWDNGRGNFYELFGPFYYSFTVGDSYFIALDDANEKNLDPVQMDWLKNELAASQKFKYRFVFLHVPLFKPRGGQGLFIEGGLEDAAFAKRLNHLLDDNNVTMVFTSHIHGYFRGVWRHTPYILTGGAGAEMARYDKDHYFYHYIRVRVSEDGVRYHIVRLKSHGSNFVTRWLLNAWLFIYSWISIHYLDIVIVLAVVYFGFYTIYRLRNRRRRKAEPLKAPGA